MKYVVVAIVIALVVFYFAKSAMEKKQAAENIALGNEYLVKNKSNSSVIETASGLQYEVIQKGQGTEHPKANSTVTVHYHGSLIDGTIFDSSVERGEPLSFPLNQVIKGWTEGVQLMVVGDKFKFFIPAELGYGNRSAGKITAGSLLIFEVELLAIK